MSEKIPTQSEESPQGENEEERESDVIFTRHSRATYSTYAKILGSEDPQQPVDIEDQEQPDLGEAGRELAKEKAEAFFDTLDPERDALYFVSSGEMRALETADIYRKVAHERGFEVISHGETTGRETGTKPKTGTQTAHEIGGGEIREVRNLTPKIKNMLVQAVFNPKDKLPEINWDAVDDETREKWEQAQEIIAQDDKGSWGANFFHHSEAVQELFPDVIDSAIDVHEREFKNLTRLVDFAQQKIAESEHEKRVKVLSFGHENYMGYALQEHFGDEDIGNCESIGIRIDDDGVHMTRFEQEGSES